ncbi:putative reverse transcriptase domain-containing protein [Tanacetum coccineum]
MSRVLYLHVSSLKKCLSDEPLAIPLDEIHVDDRLNFIEEPVEIMDRKVKCLKQSRIPIVKVRWNSRRGIPSRPPSWGCDKIVFNQSQGIENQIMAALAIAISSDSSDESVGSPPSRVILFGDIPTVIPSTSVVAPETSTIAHVISSAALVVETTLVASPTGLYGLVPYSGSDSDSPDEMSSPEHISPLPAISPFLCTDSSEAPDSSDGPPSQDPYVATVARWRSRVTTRPSSSSEFPIAPVTAPPGIRRWSAILIRPGEAIPFGRPYRTHLNGPRKLLTARKRVGPLPARRLAWRHASPRSSDHHSSSSSSSSDSSPVHSSGLDAPDQAHSGSSTRDVSPRLGYPPRRAPRHSEAFHRWCAAPLSTLYPPTTSESSSGDSSERPLHSSSHSAGPSRKRCRSPVDSVPSSTPVMGSLAPTHLILDDTEEYKVGIDPMSTSIVEEEIVEPAGEDSSDSSGTRDGIVRIVGIETVQRLLEADQLIDRGQRVSMIERIDSLRDGNDIGGGDGNGKCMEIEQGTADIGDRSFKGKKENHRNYAAYDLFMEKEMLMLMTSVLPEKNESKDGKPSCEIFGLENDMATFTQRAYMAGNNEKNGYEGTLRIAIGGITDGYDCTYSRTPGPNQRVITCFECGAQGHYRKDCPKVKNQNRGNKAGFPDARGKAYVLGGGDANSGSNTVTDVSYAVLRGCTLGLLGHPFNIDLMPIDLVRIPYENEILIVQGDKSDKEKKSTLSIISCEKAQKYMEKVFPEDIPGLPSIRQVELQINLVPGATPVARSPYRLTPSEMEELSTQLQELSDKGFIRPSSSPWGAPTNFGVAQEGRIIRQVLKVRLLAVEDTDSLSYCPFLTTNEGILNPMEKLTRHTEGTLGTQLDMSTAYHPQTDGQSKRTIQMLEDMLQACVMDFEKGWDRHLPLIEFSYNNNYHTSIKVAPFEALYGRKFRSPICWADEASAHWPMKSVVYKHQSKIIQIKYWSKDSRDRQKELR